MTPYHSSHHWIPVAIVVAIALLTLTEVHGQRTDSSAMFQGRPAMAGAQAGEGAMAGPPQGGLGVQGQDHSQVDLRKHSTGVADMPQGQVKPTTDAIAENRAVRRNQDIVPPDRDHGVAKDRRSIAQRAKDAIRRIAQRSRHGVSDGDIRTADK